MSQFNLIFILANIRTKFSATVDCCGLLKICHGVATALSQNRAVAVWNANNKTTNSSPARLKHGMKASSIGPGLTIITSVHENSFGAFDVSKGENDREKGNYSKKSVV